MAAKKYKVSIAIGLGLYMMGHIPIKAVNVSPGATFSVSISCANVEGTVTAVGENASIAAISNNWCDRQTVIKITATASTVQGVAKISLVGVDAVGNANTSKLENYAGKVIGSSLVHVVATGTKPIPNTPNTTPNAQANKPQIQQTQPRLIQNTNENTTQSSDNTLSSLTLSSGSLRPAFSPAVNTYEVHVTDDHKSIHVSAKPKSAKAIVNGIGEKPLTVGKHTIVVSVKAENGSIKEYTIHVNVSKKAELSVAYNGVKLGVVQDVSDVHAPNKQFEKTSMKIEGKDVVAWKNNVINKTIVYLVDEVTGAKNFYIYNTATNKVETIFKPMSILGQNFYIVDIDKALQSREGMKFGTVKIDKDELQGWTYLDAAFKNYALIYVMNEKGDMVYYQYEDTEKTLQLYPNVTQKPAVKKDESANITKMEAALKQKDQMMYVLIGVSVLFFILSMVFFFRRGKRKKHRKINVNQKQFDDGVHIERNALAQDDDE